MGKHARVLGGLWLLAGAALATAGCGDDSVTGIDVVVSEVPQGALTGMADELVVTVDALRESGDARVLQERRALAPGPDGRLPPWSLRVRPARDGDAGRVLYRFEAIALLDGVAVLTARARITFVRGVVVTLPLRLDAACLGVPACGGDATCSSGTCVDDFVPACSLLAQAPPECRDDPRPSGDAGVDLGVPPPPPPPPGDAAVEGGPTADASGLDADVDGGDAGGGDAAVDACVAERDCAALGVECGETADGCGELLDCGACTGRGETCGGGGVPHRCGVAVGPDTAAPAVEIVSGPAALDGVEAELAWVVTDTGGSGVDLHECSLDGAPFDPCGSGDSGSILLTALADGAHELSVRARDRAGNRSVAATYAWVVDATGPTCGPLLGPGCINGGGGLFSTSCMDAHRIDHYECRAGPAASLPPFGRCALPFVWMPAAGGASRVEVRALDELGNASAAAALPVGVDLVAPTLSLSDVPPSLTNARSTTIAGSVSGGVCPSGCSCTPMLACSLDGAPVTCRGPSFAVMLSGLTDGLHTFAATASDEAGNATTVEHRWTVDATPPVVTVPARPDLGTGDYDATVDLGFTWTCTDALSGCSDMAVTCTVDGTATDVTCAAGAGSTRVGVMATRSFGPHDVVVSVRDLAGNVGTGMRQISVSRCAREFQLPHRSSNGFWRGDCCSGLVESDWNDGVIGVWHPRGDGSCRPMSDYDFQAFEVPGFGAGCAPGLRSASDWGASCSLPAAAMCLASRADADVLCGDGPPPASCPTTPCQTPFHGYAGQGWHGSRALGCSMGQFGTSGVFTVHGRAGNADVCFTSVDLGAARYSISSSEACKSGLTRHCRDNPVAGDVACVCSPSSTHPYTGDGHG